MKSGIKTLAIWLILGFIFIGLLSAVFNNSDTKMSYSELLSRINTGDIKEIDLTYVKQALIGIENNKEAIDAIITENLHNWKLERVSKVNLSILRLATYELLYDEQVPRAVVINEALEITRRYSDEKSVSFINGVLDKIDSTK